MIIKIIKDWENPDLKRQTPNNSGKWNNHEFVFGEEDKYDILVILNRTKKNIDCDVLCTWMISQEPPTKSHVWHKKVFRDFDLVLTQFPSQKNNIKNSHGALPWHIGKTYDELQELNLSDIKKEKSISLIASNLQVLDGHKKRYDFVKRLQETSLEIDFFGKGINPIDDKFEAIAPYKYSIAIENSSHPNYWTEKISDCFLSYTIPIYYGCTNISKYFPPSSFIEIDLNDFSYSLDKIKDTINSNYYETNIESIKEARNLVLNKYQLFPFISDLISKHQPINFERKKRTVRANLAPWENNPSITRQIKDKLKSMLNV